MAEKPKKLLLFNEEIRQGSSGGGGNAKDQEILYADFMALIESGTYDPDTTYFIKDWAQKGGGSGDGIKVISQADFDKLSEEEINSNSYYIYDAEPDGIIPASGVRVNTTDTMFQSNDMQGVVEEVSEKIDGINDDLSNVETKVEPSIEYNTERKIGTFDGKDLFEIVLHGRGSWGNGNNTISTLLTTNYIDSIISLSGTWIAQDGTILVLPYLYTTGFHLDITCSTAGIVIANAGVSYTGYDVVIRYTKK